MDFKSGSQVRQILRNSIKFQSSDTEGMSRETSYKKPFDSFESFVDLAFVSTL